MWFFLLLLMTSFAGALRFALDMDNANKSPVGERRGTKRNADNANKSPTKRNESSFRRPRKKPFNPLSRPFASGKLLVHMERIPGSDFLQTVPEEQQPATRDYIQSLLGRFAGDLERWQGLVPQEIDPSLSMSLLHPKIKPLEGDVGWLFDASHCKFVLAAWGDLYTGHGMKKTDQVKNQLTEFILQTSTRRASMYGGRTAHPGPVFAASQYQEAVEALLQNMPHTRADKNYTTWIDEAVCDWECIAIKILEARQTFFDNLDRELDEGEMEGHSDYVATCSMEALLGVVYSDSFEEVKAKEIYANVLKLIPTLQLVKFTAGAGNADSEISLVGTPSHF